MADNPYHPPDARAIEPNVDALGGAGSFPAFLITWTIWIGLVLSIVWDVGVVVVAWDRGPDYASTSGLAVLGMIAVAQVAMVLFMRWLVFRFMLRRMQPGGAGPAIVGIIGAVVIYGIYKGTGTFSTSMAA